MRRWPAAAALQGTEEEGEDGLMKAQRIKPPRLQWVSSHICWIQTTVPVRSTPQQAQWRKRGGKNREGSQEASLKFSYIFWDSVHLLTVLLCGCLRMFTFILDKCWLWFCVRVCVYKHVCWCLVQTPFITQIVSTCPLFMSALQMSPI